jgi:nicotinamidase-related amidase
MSEFHALEGPQLTKTALILIDIQNDYFEGGLWPVEGMQDASHHAARLLAHARATQMPVFHVRHEIPFADAPFFRPASAGAQIHPIVAPATDEPVILKHKPNSFLGTDLKARLDSAGITDVILAGAMSQMCIDATTRAASDFGYGVTVVQDACAAKSQSFKGRAVPAQDVHATIMAALAGTYAQIVDCTDVVGAA